MITRLFIPVAVVAVALGGCSDWQHDVTRQGAMFRRVKVEANGVVVGDLARDAVIGGRACRQGWVHLHPNGTPEAWSAAEPLTWSGGTIPRGIWIRQDERGTIVVCAFPRPMEVQGHWVRGTGGAKGVQTSFHPGGALKSFYPVADVVIDGVPCRASLLNGWVELYESGRLRSALLDADLERDGIRYRQGTRVIVEPDGRMGRPPAQPEFPPHGA